MSLLSAEDLTSLLAEVGRDLDARGLAGQLFLVGGAAMALAYSRRRVTRDIDAVFEPKATVYDVAREVGARHGLPDGWLNDSVKGFRPGDDPHATVLFDQPGLTVRVASAEYPFAMKAMASRVERDADDLHTLYRRCGFRSVDEALDAVERHYPARLLSPRTTFLLRELLQEQQTPDTVSGPAEGREPPPEDEGAGESSGGAGS